MYDFAITFYINKKIKENHVTNNIDFIINKIDDYIDFQFYETYVSTNFIKFYLNSSFFKKENIDFNNDLIELIIFCNDECKLLHLQNEINKKINDLSFVVKQICS